MSARGMQQESYLKMLPKELLKELLYHYVITGISTIAIRDDEQLNTLWSTTRERSQELSKVEQFASILNTPQFQQLFSLVEEIKGKDIQESIQKVKAVARHKELTPFFDDVEFNRLLISYIYDKTDPTEREDAELIAQEIGTPGALVVRRHLQFINGIEKNDIKTVQDYLAKGFDVNAKNRFGETALMIAAQNGNKNIVEMLIASGANVNAQNSYGSTALIKATCLHENEVVELLLDHGAAINAQSEDGNTALMWAANNAYNDMLELLLERGAAIDARDNTGRTALYMAIQEGHKDIVELLRTSGAK